MPTYTPGKLVLRKDYIPLDASYSSVSLLLHGDGTNGSTTITDNSLTPKTVTAVGNAQISTAQSKFGGASLLFDKVDDRLTLAASSDFAFGTGDFTVEAWIYSRDVSSANARGWFQTSTVTGGLQPSYGDGLSIAQGVNSAGLPANGGLFVAIGGPNYFGSSGAAAVLFVNQWQHIAVTRSGSTCRAFVNGSQVGSRVNSANLTGSNLVVGGYYDIAYLYDGYIDDLRITKGIARYTSNFTPPTESFPGYTPGKLVLKKDSVATDPNFDPSFASVSLLLHGDGTNGSTTITDNSPSPKTVTAVGNAQISTAQSKFGGASIAFDGTGDYLTAANNSRLNFDSGDFTIECWFYAAALPSLNNDNLRVAALAAYGGFFVSGNAQGYEFLVDFTGNKLIMGRPASVAGAIASFTFALNTWYHVAYTRAGSTNRLFVDGQSLTLTTDTYAPITSPTGTLRIGSERFFAGYDLDLNGYIDDLRITKGVARYTAAFTPPTQQLPNY